MVCEDGREYYAQSCEFDPEKANEWVWNNVFPHLQGCPGAILTGLSLQSSLLSHRSAQDECIARGCPWRKRIQIANEIALFCNPEQYGKPEFWGYYSAYDHVALAQLYGPMIGLPPKWPMYTRDIKQWCDMLGNPKLPEQGKGEHNALQDARWNKQAWEFFATYKG